MAYNYIAYVPFAHVFVNKHHIHIRCQLQEGGGGVLENADEERRDLGAPGVG